MPSPRKAKPTGPSRPSTPAARAPDTGTAAARAVPDPARAPVVAPAPVPTALPASPAMPTGRLVAILTAAATAALGRPVGLRRIRFLNDDPRGGWALAGRITLHASHRLGRSL